MVQPGFRLPALVCVPRVVKGALRRHWALASAWHHRVRDAAPLSARLERGFPLTESAPRVAPWRAGRMARIRRIRIGSEPCGDACTNLGTQWVVRRTCSRHMRSRPIAHGRSPEKTRRLGGGAPPFPVAIPRRLLSRFQRSGPLQPSAETLSIKLEPKSN